MIASHLPSFRLGRRLPHFSRFNWIRSLFAQNSKWMEFAKQFEITSGDRFSSCTLTGKVEGFKILIIGDSIHDWFSLDLDGSGKIPSSLDLPPLFETELPHSMFLPASNAETDVVTRVIGRNEETAALLGKETRSFVLDEVAKLDATVCSGHIRLGQYAMANAPIVLRRVVNLAQRLSLREQDIPEHLAGNALHDSVLGVRLQNLAFLQENYSSHPQAFSVSRALLKSSFPALRLAACRFLGEEGLQAAEELAVSRPVDAIIRSAAWEILFQRLPAAECIRILENMAAEPADENLALLVDGATRLNNTPLQNILLQHVDRMRSEISARLCDALQQITNSESEEALIRLLTNDSDKVSTAAARALGRTGSVKAVEYLQQAIRRRGSTGFLKSSSREAILQIQSRLAGAEAGQLSVVETAEETGALSLAEKDSPNTGAVSFPSRGEQPEEIDPPPSLSTVSSDGR